MGLTEEIAAFVHDFQYGQIPVEAIRVIKNAFLDTVGTGIAGKDEEGSRIVRSFVALENASPVSTIWGTNQKSSPSYTALVNGAMAHALDFDDVNGRVQGHPSTVIVPAVMAAAEQINASGKDMLLAYLVGFEVMAYAGKLLSYTHYRKGWHGTATLGVLGATAAVGKLFGLSVEQLENALGIAVSHCSGSRQNFGTMTKPYHPGNAARSSVVSAHLAKEGFTADREIIEAPLGFISLLSYRDGNTPDMFEKIGEKLEIVASGISVKKYACCYCTHRPADAALELINQGVVNPDEVQEIIVKAPGESFLPLIHSRPTTGLEGKFSVEYVVASAIIDRDITLGTFTDEAVQRSDVQTLLRKVKRKKVLKAGNPNGGIDEGVVEVTVVLKDQKLVQEIEFPKGTPQRPLTQEELYAKFKDCVKNVMSEAEAQTVIDIFNQLDEQSDVKDLFNSIK